MWTSPESCEFGLAPKMIISCWNFLSVEPCRMGKVFRIFREKKPGACDADQLRASVLFTVDQISPLRSYVFESCKSIRVYYKSNPKDTTYAVYGWARSLLKKYGYYFKDKYYSQEKEIRSIITPKLEDIHMWKDPRDGEIFPRSYVLLKEPLIVESVMLGPKCPNPEQIAVALKNLGIKRILRSNIHFQ